MTAHREIESDAEGVLHTPSLDPSVMTDQEIIEALSGGAVGEVEVLERLDDGRYRVKITPSPHSADLSGWVVDVWNCRGVLKRRTWGVGYGSIPPAPCVWVDLGWFTVPVREGADLTDEESAEVVDLLFDVLDHRGGALNMSGFYPVSEEEIEQVRERLGDKLFEGDLTRGE